MRILKIKHIRTKLIIFYSFLIGIISLFVSVYFPENLKSEKMKSIKEKVYSISELTSFSVSPGVYFEDIKSIDEALLGIMQNKDLSYLIIADKSGKTLYEYNKSQAFKSMYLSDAEFSTDLSIFKAKTDIRFNREIIGKLYIGISLEELYTDVGNSKKSILLISVIVFIIGLIIVFIISIVITRPINKMENTIDQITANDMSKRVNINTKDEIWRLGQSFNLLLDELENSHNNLNKVNNALKVRINVQNELIEKQHILSESLIKSEQKYRFLADNTVDIIWTTDLDLNSTYITPSVEKLFGYSVEEWLALKLSDYLAVDSISQIVHSIYNEIEKAKLNDYDRNRPLVFEAEILKKDNTKIWVENTVKVFSDEAGELSGIFFFARDISLRKDAERQKRQLEEQLLHTQKIDSIGRLSGGIAHDLNNMLTPIIGYADILKNKLAGDEAMVKRTQRIINAAYNARDLVKQLLAFARKQTLDIKPINLNVIIKDFNAMLSRVISANIPIIYNLNDELSNINADIVQIQQILINLCVNAQDAMPEGGKIYIETDNVTIDEYYTIEHEKIGKGNYITLTIRDTGSGISPEIQTKVFEPFFTTKGIGKGTGLGLSTVYGIVKQQKGYIWLYSEVGIGTTIKIHFPAINSVAAVFPVKETEPDDNSGIETLLVVEDQKNVLDMVLEYLEMNGYMVLSAQDGNNAVEVYKKYNDKIHLLITDIILPDINGKQVFDNLSQYDSELKVLYMSGYSEEIITVENVLKPGVNFIQKPFNLKDLGIKIRKILDGIN